MATGESQTTDQNKQNPGISRVLKYTRRDLNPQPSVPKTALNELEFTQAIEKQGFFATFVSSRLINFHLLATDWLQ
jgi:hypothetical protein